MVKIAEAFFSSLGFEELPASFWERSLFVKPADRDVVCHPYAYNVDEKEDLRIKMCIDVNAEDFNIIHHELGHNYYYRAYNRESYLYRDGANNAFHEAVGDTLALSITPEYLQQIGLLDEVPDASGDLGLLMKRALVNVAFLPFGLLVDQWRWKVFAGEASEEEYNDLWWTLREQYQGVAAPRNRPCRTLSIRAPSTTCRAMCPIRVTSCLKSCNSSFIGPCVKSPATRGRCTAVPSTAASRPVNASTPCWKWAAASPGR